MKNVVVKKSKNKKVEIILKTKLVNYVRLKPPYLRPTLDRIICLHNLPNIIKHIHLCLRTNTKSSSYLLVIVIILTYRGDLT